MSPLEAAVRAACRVLGVHPDEWPAFREIGEAAMDAFVDALPEHLRDAVRDHINSLTPPS